ncbi:MAG: tRNA 2-thiouridine(34) synthase MnmA [bacterium]|nr:tRNA 2-thiouridine(34) synthase MnmA [bacterium]
MKIAVLISGGVDSSVALKLLKDQGHELTAFYIKIWLEDELSFLGSCPWEEDLKFIRGICDKEKIRLEIIPLQKEYFDTVVDYTLTEVKAGRTPNPDIMCNNKIKFDLALEKIDPSFEKIATGHYAQVIEENGKFLLKKAPDKVKDQTYFLSNLSQEQLSRLIFPIGSLDKSQVRELAKKYKLPNKERKDSQGICFLGKLKYIDFIRHYLGDKKGDILNRETGEKVGTHKGYWFYTIGQRKGIGIGGLKGSSGEPFYVVEKDLEKNIVYVSNNYHSADKKRDQLEVGNLNWFSGKSPSKDRLQVKLRHGEKSYNCKINQLSKEKFSLKLDSHDQGIAAGQFAAFYDGEICLGSGVINRDNI